MWDSNPGVEIQHRVSNLLDHQGQLSQFYWYKYYIMCSIEFFYSCEMVNNFGIQKARSRSETLFWKSVPVVTFRSTQRDLTLEVFFNAIRLSGILYQGKARYIRPDN